MSTPPTGTFVRATADPGPSEASAPVSGGILLSQANVPEIQNCLGAITMLPGATGDQALAHATSEVMYVARGRGELHTDDDTIEFTQGDAIFIPAGAWHWLRNTGDDVLVSVFSFPAADRPVTQTKQIGA